MHRSCPDESSFAVGHLELLRASVLRLCLKSLPTRSNTDCILVIKTPVRSSLSAEGTSRNPSGMIDLDTQCVPFATSMSAHSWTLHIREMLMP